MAKNEYRGLKRHRSGTKEDRVQCSNCKCVRYGKCHCAKPGAERDEKKFISHHGGGKAPVAVEKSTWGGAS